MSDYQWKPFTLLVSAEEVERNMKVGDKYKFTGGVDEKGEFFTIGSLYEISGFGPDGDPFFTDNRGKSHLFSLDLIPFYFSKAYESPIREVTRRELVPGKYGKVILYEKGEILLGLCQTSEELREAAHTLNQIAEYLESEGKQDE